MATIIALVDYEFDFVSFGIDVKECRLMMGWTQDRLGEHIGYSGAFISGIETSNTGNSLTISAFIKTCNFLQLKANNYFALTSHPYVRYEEHTDVVIGYDRNE